MSNGYIDHRHMTGLGLVVVDGMSEGEEVDTRIVAGARSLQEMVFGRCSPASEEDFVAVVDYHRAG